jgi:hypothetical protein
MFRSPQNDATLVVQMINPGANNGGTKPNENAQAASLPARFTNNTKHAEFNAL